MPESIRIPSSEDGAYFQIIIEVGELQSSLVGPAEFVRIAVSKHRDAKPHQIEFPISNGSYRRSLVVAFAKK